MLGLATGLGFTSALALLASHSTSAESRPKTVVKTNLSLETFSGVTDLAGHPANPFASSSAKAIVLLFVNPQCPISNRYAPEIQRIERQFAKEGVVFWLIQPDGEQSPAEDRQYLKEYRYAMKLLRDPEHVLVNLAQVHITPEVAVFLPDGRSVYRGRIDNRFAEIGQARPAATQHDLSDCLEAIVTGASIATPETEAVGCFISKRTSDG